MSIMTQALAGHPPDPAWSDDQVAVWRTVEAWNDAFEANDPDTYFGYIDEDVVVITPSSPYRVEYKGPDRREFEFSIEKGFGEIQFFQELSPRVDVFGDTAVVTYYSRGIWSRSGEQMVYLKETNVLVREENQWKIVHIHVSR